MALIKFTRDYTRDEASSFVAALAERLVGCLDLPELLDDIQAEADLDEGDLREFLINRLEAFAQSEDEKIVDWIIAYLLGGGD